jgi:hypothetical protein
MAKYDEHRREELPQDSGAFVMLMLVLWVGGGGTALWLAYRGFRCVFGV